MARQDLEFVATALGDAVESAHYSTRLNHGLRLRAAMFAAMAQGQGVDHYRMVWLVQSVGRLLEFAKSMCKEFDAAHPDDMASALDLADVLTFTTKQVTDTLPQPKTDTTPT